MINVIARGYNHYTPYNYYVGNSTHAEVDAINKLPKSAKMMSIDIYVCRVDRQGELKYSRPCEDCQHFMKKKVKEKRISCI